MAESNVTQQSISSLTWLADAPLFIDADQVSQLYDAVVRPETTDGTITLTITQRAANTISGKVGVEAEVSVDSLIKRVFPFLNASIKGTFEGGGNHEASEEGKRTVELHPISTPQRQLVQLALHYAVNQSERLSIVSSHNIQDPGWQSQEYILRLPRALIFLDLPSREEASQSATLETKLIPLAVEFADGEVALIFEALEAKDGKSPQPKWDDSDQGRELSVVKKEHLAYWQWFVDNFNPSNAAHAVEKAAKTKGRVRWIDYRVPVKGDGQTLHLHVRAGENYDTGVFAYYFIKRGYEHGLRVVGTLKSGLDMNVLAVFEK